MSSLGKKNTRNPSQVVAMIGNMALNTQRVVKRCTRITQLRPDTGMGSCLTVLDDELVSGLRQKGDLSPWAGFAASTAEHVAVSLSLACVRGRQEQAATAA
jgi:hypothetical protein